MFFRIKVYLEKIIKKIYWEKLLIFSKIKHVWPYDLKMVFCFY